MNVDHILTVFNQHSVRYLLIGGMNFMLRHKPILTYDLDIWIEDTEENRLHCELALAALTAEWGATEESWAPVSIQPADWLAQQEVFCLSSPHGAIDEFRSVAGLDDWRQSWSDGFSGQTSTGVSYRGLSDEDMLRCQLALDAGLQKRERIEALQSAIQRGHGEP